MSLSGLEGHQHSLSSSEVNSSSSHESESTKPYKCGQCQEHFLSISILHSHLKGDSYRFEADTMTAFPENRSACSKGDEPVPPESSEKYYRVYRMKKCKRKRSEDSSDHFNIIKIVDEPSLKVGENESACMLYSGVDNVVDAEHAEVHIAEETDRCIYTDASQFDIKGKAKENTVIKAEADIGEYVEHLTQYSESNKVESNNYSEEQIDMQNHPTEILISALEDSSESGTDQQPSDSVANIQTIDGEVLVVETTQEDKMDDSVSCNIKLPALYNALVSTNLKSDIQTDLVDVNQTVKEFVKTSDVNQDNRSEYPKLEENDAFPTVAVDNVSGEANEDQDLKQAVAAFDKLGESHSYNKQVVLTLYGMETGDDGSLQVVVGEQDAAVFNTPVGDELLKALKTQVQDIPVNGSTQIVFSYSDTQLTDIHQDPNCVLHVRNNLSENKSGIFQDENPDNESFRPAKVPKKIDDDSLLPNLKNLFPTFKIQLPTGDAESGQNETETNELKPIVIVPSEMKPIVFKTKHEKLTMPEALNILTECNLGMHTDLISKTQPIKAKGGELYVVDLEALPNKKDCRYDQYIWVNCVARKFPQKNPILHKHVFKIRLPNSQFSDAFQRHIYQFIEEAKFCVIHYLGHESVFQPIAHGNSKSGAVFNRTCPSVLTQLKALSKEEGVTANKVYKKMESLKVPDNVKGFRTPRNLSQIKNTFRYARKKKAMQEDGL